MSRVESKKSRVESKKSKVESKKSMVERKKSRVASLLSAFCSNFFLFEWQWLKMHFNIFCTFV